MAPYCFLERTLGPTRINPRRDDGKHWSLRGIINRIGPARDAKMMQKTLFDFYPESVYDDASATMSSVRASPGAPQSQVLSDSETLVRLVLARLERVSVDSGLAHRASGIRGTLLKSLDDSERGHPVNPETLRLVMQQAFRILEQEAGRIAR
jgi:hypothetical protein